MKKIIILCFWALLTSLPTYAQQEQGDLPEVQERKYVTDKLRLSLYESSTDKSKVLKLLVSGDVLDIFEISGPYAKVRTKDGDIGWVKNGFLVSTPTATFKLTEEQEKNRILSEQLEKYANTRKLVEDYENTIEKIMEDYETADEELKQARERLETLTSENSELRQEISESQQQNLSLSDILYLLKTYWYLILIAAVLLLTLGFIVGMKLIEAQVRRKFHGIKVW